MKTLKDSELKTFEQLATLRQGSLKQVLASFLKKHYSTVVHTKEYIFAVGDIPVALTAHMDTVFRDPPEEIFFDPKKNVMWSPNGLGADDRAGIFAIIQIIRAGYKPHIIFTTDEEIGGVGAAKLASLDCPFDDLLYVIELDRRGSNDCVFYECENMDFTDYVEGFGFDYNFGSYSDICEFCPAWGIAGVNLSIGYHNEHSVSETLFIGQMLSTIEKVKHMLDDAKNLIEPFIYIASPFFHGAWYGNSSGMYNREVHKCNKCRRYFMGEELFYTMQQDKTLRLRCSECLADDAVNWCMKCGTPYEKSAQDEGVCPRCKELKEKRENGITKPNK